MVAVVTVLHHGEVIVDIKASEDAVVESAAVDLIAVGSEATDNLAAGLPMVDGEEAVEALEVVVVVVDAEVVAVVAVDGVHLHITATNIALTIASPTLIAIRTLALDQWYREVLESAAAMMTLTLPTSASKEYALQRHASLKRITLASEATSARISIAAALKLQLASTMYALSRNVTLLYMPVDVEGAAD